jgi:hypothetical protein
MWASAVNLARLLPARRQAESAATLPSALAVFILMISSTR